MNGAPHAPRSAAPPAPLPLAPSAPAPLPLAALPLWFWLLPVLAALVWWPIDPYWQSDDFFAVHYAQDLRRVAADFVGPQYGATDLFLFYRPLITLAFWFDLQFGGAAPFVGHLSNVLAHAVSALLVGLLWRRFLPAAPAMLAGLLWATMPSHSGTVQWTVGRVDGHTTVWYLLALWCCLRADEQRRGGGSTGRWRWAQGLATAAALASKELALMLPAVSTLLLACTCAGTPWRTRLLLALRGNLVPWCVLLAYLPWRVFVLGQIGGYAASSFAPGPMLHGLGQELADLLVPLRWCARWPDGWSEPAAWAAAIAPPAIALALALRRPMRLLLAAATFAVATVPMANFLAIPENPHNLRYYYLPAAALCGLLASGGRLVSIAVLLAWAWPFVAVRQQVLTADRESAAMHRALQQEALEGTERPMFVAGLPRTNPTGIVMQLHFGIDRLLQPPLCSRPTPVCALRPLYAAPTAFQLYPAGELPTALPFGSTWFFVDATALGRAPLPPPLPDLVVHGDRDGVLDLTTPVLETLLPSDAPPLRLTTPGVRPMLFRLTLFTACGYLTSVFFDHGDGAAADGTIDLRKWFGGDALAQDPARQRAARIAAEDVFVGDALTVPTTVDLIPEFPVLLEAGYAANLAATLSGREALQFVATHRAQRPLTFRFDRGYPGWVRRAQGRRY